MLCNIVVYFTFRLGVLGVTTEILFQFPKILAGVELSDKCLVPSRVLCCSSWNKCCVTTLAQSYDWIELIPNCESIILTTRCVAVLAVCRSCRQNVLDEFPLAALVVRKNINDLFTIWS